MSNLSHQFARRVVAFVLALVLGVAPTLPAFAIAPAPADDMPDVAHASVTVGDAADLHADHGKVHPAADATDHKGISCDQHDRCSGSCCAACAQCFTATSAMPTMFLTARSPRLSSVPRLHDRLVVAAHNRPPAV